MAADQPTYVEFIRQGEQINCEGCGRMVMPAGTCAAPIFEADGSTLASRPFGTKQLYAPCAACGRETHVPLPASPFNRIQESFTITVGAPLIVK